MSHRRFTRATRLEAWMSDDDVPELILMFRGLLVFVFLGLPAFALILGVFVILLWLGVSSLSFVWELLP